jgi:hypothetical protein
MLEGYAEVLAADRRLALLRLMVESGGEAAESALHKGLHLLGHRVGVTRDVVRQELRELAERSCVELSYFQGDRVMIATLTGRGADAANGDVKVQGVAAPAMGRRG